MEALKPASALATVTPLRPLRPRLGRAVRGSARSRDIFGWPCAAALALEGGGEAYLLDFEHATHAPSQLRVPLEQRALEALLSGQSARVIVQSIFGKLIVVGVEWTGGFEPDGAFGVAEAA